MPSLVSSSILRRPAPSEARRSITSSSSSISRCNPWPRPQKQRRCCPLPAAAAASASSASPTSATPQKKLWDDDGSEGSAAQHHGSSNRAWAETDASRAFRRTSFTFRDWRKHRSTERYLYHLSTLKASRIVRGLMLPVTVISAFATLVAAYQTLHAGALAGFLPALPLVPIEPFQLTSFALALLLVFRTNGAYQRWHEARCVFGRICDASRDVFRQILAVFPRDRPGGRDLMARWLVAYCFASKWALREEGRRRADLEGWLAPRELDAMMSSPDPAHYSILVLSHTLKANVAGQQLVKLMDRIGSMMYDLSSCNRILTTPIPLSYTRHTTRFMLLWLLLLPLALWAKCGWGCVPATALVSLALLTIEAIGVSLEEPFSILALEKICDGLSGSIATLKAMDGEAYALAAAASGAAAGAQSRPAGWGSMGGSDDDDEEIAFGADGAGVHYDQRQQGSVARKVGGAVSGR